MKTNLPLFVFFTSLLLTSLILQNVTAQVQDNNVTIHQDFQNAVNDFNPLTHTGTFALHPDYLLDYIKSNGDPVFVPYSIYEGNSNGQNYINFESAHNSATFYEDTCTFQLFDGGKILANDKAIIPTISFNLQYAQNQTDVWFQHAVNGQLCNITHVEQGNQITFDMIQTINGDVEKDVQIIFNLQTHQGQVIPKITNNNSTNIDTKYGWAVQLSNLDNVKINNRLLSASAMNQDTVQFDQSNNRNSIILIKGLQTTLTFDPENNINHYLWSTKIEKNQDKINLILDYKNAPNALLPNQSLVIDPSFTSGNGVSWAVASNPANNNCDTYNQTNGGARIVTPASGSIGGSNYCVYNIEQFSISNFLKQWTATQVNYQYSISPVASNDKSCDYIQELNQPSVTAAATLFNDVRTGAAYLSSDTLCQTVSTNNSVNLGATAVTDFNNAITAGHNWFALGGRFHDMEKTHFHADESDFSANNLVITYSWNPPAPITDLSCSNTAINTVNCNWSTPTSTNPILGYYLTKNQSLSAPLFSNHLVRYFKFDYNDPTSNIIDFAQGKNATFTSGSYVGQSSVLAQGINFTTNQVLTSASTNLPISSSDRTVAFWMKTPTSMTNSGYIFSWGANTTNNLYGILLNQTKLILVGSNNDITAATTLSSNKLYHIVTTVSNNGATRDLWINGTEDANFPKTTTALSTTSSSLLFGNATLNLFTGSGGSKTTSGNKEIHTFTSSGNFITSGVTGTVSVLTLAGGGAGGGSIGSPNSGGAGGAGGLNLTNSMSLPVNTYPVTVGTGGVGAAGSKGANGLTSSFNGISMTGGGGGGEGGAGGATGKGGNGGSGGGGGGSGANGTFGTGISPQGFNGGFGWGLNHIGSGGGGGAGAKGVNGSGTNGGAGGVGLSYSISGASVMYACGGGGAATLVGGASAGCASGGAGATANAGNATANLGGGGGGSETGKGGNGGSGVVIISFRAIPTTKIPVNTMLDDFRIYNNVLTNSQITTLYNYRLISSLATSYTDLTSIYPFVYNYNFAAVSSLGQITPLSGSNVRIAPYNVIDPPYQTKATLAADNLGFYINATWKQPKVANTICVSQCIAQGYKVQLYNSTTSSYQTISNNQSATSIKIRTLNPTNTQNIRIFTLNHGGVSSYTYPLNDTTFPKEVSRYMLQNNLIDSRNQNNGTLTGNWNFTTGFNGNMQALDGKTFDKFGSTSIPTGTANRTVTTWIYPKAFSTNDNAYFSYGSNSANSMFALIDANGKIDCGGAGNNLNSTTVLQLNKLYFVSCVLSNSGQTKQIYINGTLDTSATATTLSSIASNVFIGTRSDNTNKNVTAFIGDTRIFSSSLTAQQELDLFNGATRENNKFGGSLVLNYQVVGNVVLYNGTFTLLSGFPINFNVTNYLVQNGSSTVQTHNTNTPLILVYKVPNMYNFTSALNTNNYNENITVHTTSGNQVVKSNIISVKGFFTPTYKNVTGAVTPLWYGSATRNSVTGVVNLKLLASPITFNSVCSIQSSISPNDSQNAIYTNVGFVNANYSFPSRNTVYGFCTDAPVHVFDFTLGANQTGNAGILVFGDVLGNTGFFGLNWVYFFILVAASTVTAKNSVFGIIMTVALIGLLALTGSINTISDLIWTGIIMLAAFGVFMGKKLFA